MIPNGRRLGLFEVMSPLGAGGMGEVYRARDTRLGRDVALKVLPAEFATRPDRRARFEREARLLASLQHPGIAAIHGFEEADGIPFLILELVEGRTLAQRLDRGPLPVPEALEVARQIALALEAAHEKGIIHRDLKPSNVMRMADGRVKLLDFGLAKVMQEEAPAGSELETASDPASRMGFVVGTGPYMSPEQARGETVDKRTDIWSFGCVLYEMLSGRRAFPGATTSEAVAAVLSVDPDWTPLPAQVPEVVRRLLLRCVKKDPAKRLHDIADARLDLEEPPTADVVASRTHTRNAWAIAGWLLAVFLGTAGWWLGRKAERPPTIRRLEVAVPYMNDEPYVQFALSPDGARLAYTTGEAGDSMLYVRDLARPNFQAIVSGMTPYDPFFSPDGAWIAYWASSELRKVPVNGGTAPMSLCAARDLMGGTWRADGTVVFATSESGPLTRVSANGGPCEPASTLAPGELGHLWPEWLPGDRELLFTVRTGPGPDDYRAVIAESPGGPHRKLLDGAARVRYARSGHLVYGHGNGLFAVPFDLARKEVTGSPVAVAEVIRTGPSGSAQFSVASDGTLVFATPRPGEDERHLVWKGFDGSQEPLRLPPQPYSFPRLSPDGTRLAVVVGQLPRCDIWVFDLTSGSSARLTSDGMENKGPLWTPDGRRITFTSGRTGSLGLYTQVWDGSEPPRTLIEPGNQNVLASSWSPDGRSLLFGRAGEGILRTTIDAREPPGLVIGGRAGEHFARFSPDGAWIAYATHETGTPQVYVRSLSGDVRHQVSTESGSNPRWSTDGRHLYYQSGARLMQVPVSTKPTFSAGSPSVAIQGLGVGWDLAPDGRVLVALSKDTPGDLLSVHVVLNWFEELRQRVP